jgi:hypothetical protein
MRRKLNSVIVEEEEEEEEEEEAVGIIDERMTAEMTRTDLRHRRQCPQFRRSATPSLLLSRMVCPSCLLASVSRAKQQRNQHHLLHRDSAAKSPQPWASQVQKSLPNDSHLQLQAARRQSTTPFSVCYRIPMVFRRYNPHRDAYAWVEISADLDRV